MQWVVVLVLLIQQLKHHKQDISKEELIKGMEDLLVTYDMTVRNNKGKIVQYSYGDDGIDPVKVENQFFNLVNMSLEDIYNHFTIPLMMLKR